MANSTTGLYHQNITKAINDWFDKDSKRKNIDLANHFNVSEMTASRWHKGSNIPDLELLPELANFLGITLYELFGIKDPSSLSDEEKELISKYRKLEEMQNPVNTLLGIKR